MRRRRWTRRQASGGAIRDTANIGKRGAPTPPPTNDVWPSSRLDSSQGGEIVRLVQTMRGGDRPKNAHEEFRDVSVMARSQWEPWLLYRKPIEAKTVADNLRKYKTGALRRISADLPFGDVIKSNPTHKSEREIAPHPSLKPQSFLRAVVRASLPLGEGVVLDPFAGAASTLAAAEAVGYQSIGVERDPEYAALAECAIPQLAKLRVPGTAVPGAVPPAGPRTVAIGQLDVRHDPRRPLSAARES